MKQILSATALLTAVCVLTPAAQAPATSALTRFIHAASAAEATSLVDAVIASGVSFDEAYRQLRAGRTYAPDVARGVVQGSYRGESGEYFYTLDVPESYDPARRYQVRFQLHGGVGRIEASAPPRAGASARLAGAEQIYVMPYAWRDAPWWSARQTGNLRTILDRVKRTYNLDENRVVLAGVSDGGTGAYYGAMRDTTPFASFLPFIGFIGVLRNETVDADGDSFPNNLLNKPLFIVNGGRDPQYPTSLVDPYIEHLKKGGVDLVYSPQPNAAHDTSWWPELKDTIERFVTEHPRQPLPDRVTWETGDVPGRAHWLVITRLAPPAPGEPALPDVNRMSSRPAADFGIRGAGARINRVAKGSNAAQLGLKSGDLVVALNNQPVSAGTDIAEALRGFPPGRPLILSVQRGGETVRVTGRFNPTVIPGEADAILPPQQPSGRVDLVRVGNRVEATTRGVAAFTLLVSPDQFDLSQPLTVSVNGKTGFSGRVQPDLKTLITWAARDNDRTMLFAGEVRVEVEP